MHCCFRSLSDSHRFSIKAGSDISLAPMLMVIHRNDPCFSLHCSILLTWKSKISAASSKFARALLLVVKLCLTCLKMHCLIKSAGGAGCCLVVLLCLLPDKGCCEAQAVLLCPAILSSWPSSCLHQYCEPGHEQPGKFCLRCLKIKFVIKSAACAASLDQW